MIELTVVRNKSIAAMFGMTYVQIRNTDITF